MEVAEQAIPGGKTKKKRKKGKSKMAATTAVETSPIFSSSKTNVESSESGAWKIAGGDGSSFSESDDEAAGQGPLTLTSKSEDIQDILGDSVLLAFGWSLFIQKSYN